MCDTSNAHALQCAASPVIVRGDTITLEEDSKVIEARLQAVALEVAAPGRVFRVRLTAGGNIAYAVALSRGHASLRGANEAWK